MRWTSRALAVGLAAFLLFAGGCNRKAPKTEQFSARSQSAQPSEVPPQPSRPQVEIASDPIFSVPEDQLLSYSEGWKKVLAEADARAASFGSDEMKLAARNEVLGHADKSVLQAEAQANIRQLRLAYLQEHPNAAFVLGFYHEWGHNELEVWCDQNYHSSCPPLAAHVKDLLSVSLTPTEMDAALTQILRDHDAEFSRDQVLEAKNFLDQTGVADSQEDIVRRAKQDIYFSYLACALVGDFGPELLDNQEGTPENLSTQTRKAYLVDSSNGNILAELSNPWGYLNPR